MGSSSRYKKSKGAKEENFVNLIFLARKKTECDEVVEENSTAPRQSQKAF